MGRRTSVKGTRGGKDDQEGRTGRQTGTEPLSSRVGLRGRLPRDWAAERSSTTFSPDLGPCHHAVVGVSGLASGQMRT